MADSNTGTAALVRRRGPGRPFQPGQSGNPGGRPKVLLEVREAAAAHTLEAIATLAECLRSQDERVRVVAAEALLNRAWGKPPQADPAASDAEGDAEARAEARAQVEQYGEAELAALAAFHDARARRLATESQG